MQNKEKENEEIRKARTKGKERRGVRFYLLQGEEKQEVDKGEEGGGGDDCRNRRGT